MPIVLGKSAVTEVYSQAAERRWVVPTFCAENQTTIEGVLAACQAKATELGTRVPVTIALTGRYDHRPQAVWYAASRNPHTGVALFLDDCEVLARADGDYPDVDVLTHFDHGQPGLDDDLIEGDIDRFSSVMYDGSALPWERNLEVTRQFVEKFGDRVLVEGASDEIVDAGGDTHSELTTPERAAEFVEATKADMVVANLGTEHRASAADLRYHPEAARAIRDRIGTMTVLHGASSVPPDQLAALYDDGVCKVNIWTILERDPSIVLLSRQLEHAAGIVGAERAEQLVADGLLGPSAGLSGKASLAYFASAWRNEVLYDEIRRIVSGYIGLWYR